MSKKIKYFGFSLLIIGLIIISIWVARCHFAYENFAANAIANTPQNAFAFIHNNEDKQKLISPSKQKKLSSYYLSRYFAPWHDNTLTYSPFLQQTAYSIADIKDYEQQFAIEFLLNPGYGINRLENSKDWVRNIVANMDLNDFPNLKLKAITLYAANLRVLPTNDFSFGNWQHAGEGFPFDYLQQAMVPANTPALVLQSSRDHAWRLVLTNNDIGWIENKNIAYVDDKFIHAWQTQHYVTPIIDQTPVYVDKNFHFMANIGMIYPLVKLSQNKTIILIAVNNDNQKAIIEKATVNAEQVGHWPLPATKQNFGLIINHLLGKYYGWGGMDGYRDCSLTMMNLFATFGVWLPRNSSDQFFAAHYIPLQNLSADQKSYIIKTQAIPFLTLLKLPGHVVLYIGQKNGQAYIFHEFWGLPTKDIFGESGRAIVGKSAITSLELGQGYINVPKQFIDLVEGMTVLNRM